jgi:hypothetical protein
MGEIENIGVGQRINHIRHRSIVSASRIVFVFTQCLDEVILALTGQTRSVLLAGKILVMTEVAAVLLDQIACPFEPARIGGSAAGGGAGSFEIAAAMRCKSLSLTPFIMAFIGSALRKFSRNM